MTEPTMRQVRRDGKTVWQVSYSGMVREFRHDWQAKWHYESVVRLSRVKKTGKSG